jgi:hypothetical protein
VGVAADRFRSVAPAAGERGAADHGDGHDPRCWRPRRGAIVGEVVGGDAGAGAAAGAAAARAQSRRQNTAQQQQQQQAGSQQQAAWAKARAACLEGRGYSVK